MERRWLVCVVVSRCVRVSVRVWCAVDRGLANRSALPPVCFAFGVRMRTGRKSAAGRKCPLVADSSNLLTTWLCNRANLLLRGDTACKF